MDNRKMEVIGVSKLEDKLINVWQFCTEFKALNVGECLKAKYIWLQLATSTLIRY